jgi:outer membrane protein assembly factor BamB
MLACAFGCMVGLGVPLAASAQPDPAGDWPQFQADAAHGGFLADAAPPPYAPAWTVRPEAAPGQRLSAPVVGGGVVVVVSSDAILAYDASSGSQRWSVPRDGPAVSPGIAHGDAGQIVVYTDGRGPDTATVQAVDLATGAPAWGAPAALEDESKTGVTIEGTHAFVGDESGKLYAVDVADGAIAWTETAGVLAGPVAAGGGIVAAVAPASDDAPSTTVVAFDTETGDRRWSVTPDATATFGSLPAIIDDAAVVVAFPDGAVLGLSMSDGSQLWSERIPGLVSPFVAPATADGSVFLADANGGLHRVTPGGGPSWLFEFNEQALRASPVLTGTAALLGFQDGSVGVVALETGHMIFRSDATDVPVIAIALSSDAIVVTAGGSGRSEIEAFGTDPGGSLVDAQSPTIPVAGDLAIGLAVIVAVGAAIFVIGRLVSRRVPIEDPSETDTEDGPAETPIKERT